MKPSSFLAAYAGFFATSVHAALQVDFTSIDSIKAGAQSKAKSLLNYYTGYQPGQVPGLLPGPYYWWESGAMFGALIDYWYLTNDTQFNDKVTQAMLFQVGPNNDYMPPNRTKDEGNDDQSFWGMAAMTAAENNYPNPPSGQPGWLALAQAVFNTQAPRWDANTCGGGLRWQIFTFNNGYNYKNTISNGCFFNMAARLGRYTGNQTYFDWADKMWNWMETIGVVTNDFHAYDGTDANINCTAINHIEWTYNTGALMYGAAMMWNATSDPKWQAVVNGLVTQAKAVFFPANGIMKEVACEDNNKCDVDQQSFKAYLSRWMGHTTKIAPFAAPAINELLLSSAKAAVQTCTGGADGNQCGLKWTQGNDGIMGVGQEMAVLEVIQSNLQSLVPGPVTAKSGGTSVGNPSAGGGGDEPTVQLDQITTGDKAGAGILTTFILIITFGGSWWMASK